MKKSILFLIMVVNAFLINHTATAQPYLNLQQNSGSNDVYYFDAFRKWTFDTPNSTINMSKNDGSNKTYLMDDVRIITFDGAGNVVTIQYPSIMVNPTNVNAGASVTITGSDFKPNSTANINIKGPGFTQDATINTSSQGTISYNFNSTTTMNAGSYSVQAKDNNTNYTTITKYFTITNPTPVNYLEITSPLQNMTYETNQYITVEWKDKLVPGSNYPINGNKRKYSYKVEYSADGTTWQSPKTVSGEDYKNNIITLNKNFNISTTGSNFTFKVTDLYNPSNYKISNVFTVTTYATNIQIEKTWDNSYLAFNVPVKGIAADGTARIFLELSKIIQTGSPIKSVTVNLNDDDGNTGPALLGKVMKVIDLNALNLYNNEANGIITTSATDNAPGKIKYVFWYVAPDDFRGIDNTDRSWRGVNAEFTIYYQDGSIETESERILIVRPPLMMVFGLGGTAESWDNFHAVLPSNLRISFSGLGSSLTFEVAEAIDILPDASFELNARRILNFGNNPYNFDNTFQGVISKMREKGYAANRVDYIAHSMGGCVGRYAINNYPNEYKALNSQYKNYENGYINKFITINTPHKGSPFGDLVFRYIPLASNAQGILFRLINLYEDTKINITNEGENMLKSFIRPNYITANSNDFVATDAVTNLQIDQGYGGKNFESTIGVASHLITGDMCGNLSIIGPTVFNMVERQVGKDFIDLADIMYEIVRSRANSYTRIPLSFFNSIDQLPQIEKLVKFIDEYAYVYFGITQFILDGDMVVSQRSQKSGLNFGEPGVSLFSDEMDWHMGVRKDVNVGNKVYELLNAPINSTSFTYTIPKNTQRRISGDEPEDSTNRIIYSQTDTGKIKIISPSIMSDFLADSSVLISVQIKDTTNLAYLNLYFQGETYQSFKKESVINFNVQAKMTQLGAQPIMVAGVYDFVDTTKFLYDTVGVNIVTNATLQNFQVNPEIVFLSKGEINTPQFLATYNTNFTYLSPQNKDLSFTIGDTSIIEWNVSSNAFLGKKKGETFAIVSFDSLSDTVYFVVKGCVINYKVNLSITGNLSFCVGDSVGLRINEGNNVQWNTGDSTRELIVKQSGVYTAMSIDTNGCGYSSDLVKVTVFVPADTAKITTNGPAKFCQGDSIVLNSSANKYNLWSGGDTSTFITINSAGYYYLTVNDSNGCKTKDSISIATDSLPFIYIGEDTFIYAGDSILLNAGITGATYQWSNGDSAQIIKISNAGNYSVTVTDANGCRGIDSINVSILTQTNKNISFSENIRIYPIPVTNQLNVEIDNIKKTNVEISLFNLLGQQLEQKKFPNKEDKIIRTFDFNNLKEQVYFVKIRVNEADYYYKVTVVK